MHSLTIQEASKSLKLTKHTLRFWEKELEGLIVPLRTRGGQRRYTPDHLLIIREVKRLKKKGLSLEEIKSKLQKKYNSGVEPISNSQKIDLLANQIAEIVRSTVYNLLQKENL